jgi:hypothetical protein
MPTSQLFSAWMTIMPRDIPDSKTALCASTPALILNSSSSFVHAAKEVVLRCATVHGRLVTATSLAGITNDAWAAYSASAAASSSRLRQGDR